MSLAIFLWIMSDLLMVFILVRAVKTGMLRAYRPFYTYLVFQVVIDLIRWGVALSLGRRSDLYHLVYNLPTYVFPLLQLWVLWVIYRQIIGYSDTSWRDTRRSVTVVGVLTIPIMAGTLSLEGYSFFHAYHAVTLFIQMIICLQICREAIAAREKIELGQNLKGILSGLSLMVGCQAINFAGLIFVQSSAEIFWFFVQFNFLVSLIIFAYTLWDYAPIATLDPTYQHRLVKANRELVHIVKSVFADRR